MTMFTNFIVHHPFVVLITISLVSFCLLVLSLVMSEFPDFSDPQLGFETRDTLLAQRLIAWENLNEATKAFGQFAVDPNDIYLSKYNGYPLQKKKKEKKKKKGNLSQARSKDLLKIHGNNLTEDFEKLHNWKRIQQKTKKINETKKKKLIPRKDFFCGTPDERYARVVLSSVDGRDLFSYKSLISMCHIEHQLIQLKQFRLSCDSNGENECCRAWSVANYIAMLHNRSSCLAITEQDVNSTLVLLQNCSQFYHNLQLSQDCGDDVRCPVSRECSKHNMVYNVLHYLADTGFLPPDEAHRAVLHHSTIFLPVACSAKTMPYFHELERRQLHHDGVQVVAMEMGLKSALFDEYLVADAWLVGCGAACVLLCMWLYTQSLFLTWMTIVAVVFSLGVAYFMYTLVFRLEFFPFMNLLATVIAVGIGADDAFVFCKIWQSCRVDGMDDADSMDGLAALMAGTVRHAAPSMLVTSLTTAAALYTSLVSSVTAVRCFSAFAGTAVIANLGLMLMWLPACGAVLERWRCNRTGTGRSPASRPGRWTTRARYLPQRWLLACVLRLRWLWLPLLGLAAACSVVVVVRRPGLRLPDTPHFQLFRSTHPFEQYDLVFRHLFWFERLRRPPSNGWLDGASEDGYYRLPLRFVWGVLPADNGDHMDPYSRGSLQLDGTFDVAHPDSQAWLLGFCSELRGQPFYQPSPGPLLPNCFIESFQAWMQRRCTDPVDHINRYPCCEQQQFPYPREVFQQCIVHAMADLYETPAEYFMPGVAGPKFSREQFPAIQAVVVEYDSNYSHSLSYQYMQQFFERVERWTQQQLSAAPAGMRNGWFVSDLQFYDLQRALSDGTVFAVCVSMGVALLVLCTVTLNPLVSVYAVLTITCSIFTTIAVLVLLGWRLNVLESVAMSTAVGLAVDFSLHYAVSYVLYSVTSDRRTAAHSSLSSMAGPTTMAALTTGLAGAVMLPSSVLAYVQIGTFLLVVTSVSWTYSTFLFGSLLAVLGPERGFGQFMWPHANHADLPDGRNVLSETTTLSNMSTLCAMPSSDGHELESMVVPPPCHTEQELSH